MWNKSVIVPDVSFYQDAPDTIPQIDFNQMKQAGAVGVIIRAGQNTWMDSDFRYNWRAAREAGLKRGAYWFYDSRSDPSTQARLFMSTVGDDLPELLYWADLEENYGASFRGWQHWKTFLNVLRNARGGNVGIYTAPSYWTRNRPADPAELAYFGAFPLWIANYGVSQPAIPAPWTLERCLFWQYAVSADNVQRFGVESKELDMNCFNGTLEEFYQRFGGEVPAEGGTQMQYKVTWDKGVARRPSPSTQLSTGLTYGNGEVVEVVRDNIPDAADPDNNFKRWVQFTDGLYGASDYPDSLGAPRQRMVKLMPNTEPLPGDKEPFTLQVEGFKPFTGELTKE